MLNSRMQLNSELNYFLSDPELNLLYGVDYWNPDEPDLFHWKAIFNPKSGIYENGTFLLEILFKPDYPNTPPSIHFITKIYHCNINTYNGNICINTLDDWEKESKKHKNKMGWLLDSIMTLFYKQGPEDALHYGDIYINDYQKFAKTAKEWVLKYANPNDFDKPEKQKI